MAPFNTRIVRRSNALQGWAYGRDLRYGEVMGCGRGPVGAVTAAGVTAGLAGTLAAMAFPPTRALLDRLLPEPGTGPDEKTREQGWFRMAVDAETEDGRRYRAVAAGRGTRATRRPRSCSGRPRWRSPWTATGCPTGRVR